MPFVASTPDPIRPTAVGQSGNLQIVQRIVDAIDELRKAGLLIPGDISSGGGGGGLTEELAELLGLASEGKVRGSFSMGVLVRNSAPKSLYSTQNPSTVCVDETGYAYTAYLGGNRDLYIRRTDYNTGAVSGEVYVGPYQITNRDDDHGAPSIVADLKNKRLLVSYGTHGAATTIARSGPGYDWQSWEIVKVSALPSTYASMAYDPLTESVFAVARAGSTHSSSRNYPSHEQAGMIRSTDGGATWTHIGSSTGIVDTRSAFSSDAATDYYGSDCEARNGRVYVGWSIAHGPSHDGPRANVYVAYYDIASGTMRNVAGEVVGSPVINSAANLDKCRIAPAQDYTYPIHLALDPNSEELVVGYNRYDEGSGVCRAMAAKWNGSDWTITDLDVTSNYLYNGIAPNFFDGRWYMTAIENKLGDNLVASTAQKDTLAVASGGGDVIILGSDDGVVWGRETVLTRDEFYGGPATYLQSVRNPKPMLVFVAQRVDFGTIFDTVGGEPDSDSTQKGYNTATWESPIMGIGVAADLLRQRSLQILPDVNHYVNPYFELKNSAAVPTDWQTIDLSTVFPRGLKEITLKVSITGTGTAGAFNLYFRQGDTTRRDDAVISTRGEWTDPMAYDVVVPVSPDRTIQWRCNAQRATVSLRPRMLRIGSGKSLVPNPGAPATPTGLGTAGAPTSTSIPLAWNASVGATMYDLQQAPANSTSWTTIASGLSGTSYTVDSLPASTGYQFRVRARNSSGTSSYSAAFSVSTAAPPANPAMIRETFNSYPASTDLKARFARIGYQSDWLAGDTGPRTTTAGGSFALSVYETNAATKWVRDGSLTVATANQFAEAVVDAAPGSGAPHPHVAVRCATGAGGNTLTGYFLRWNPSGTVWQLYQIIDGAATLLDSLVATAPTLPYRLRLTVESSGSDAILKVYVNDTLLSDMTTTVQTGVVANGVPALGMRYQAASDSGQTITEWAAGDLSAYVAAA